MRFDVPEMYWHGNKERILSLDFSPKGDMLITAGSVDSDHNKTYMRQWEVNYQIEFEYPEEKKEGVKFNKHVKFVTELVGGHESTVNCVKFSPHGEYIASAGDDCTVIVWNRRYRPKEFGSLEQEIAWCPLKVLKSHTTNVSDLRWSKDSLHLVSGSVDNTAVLWNVEKGKCMQRLEGHQHFVQGVCIDPKFKYIITQSSDRTVRVWKKAKSKKIVQFYHEGTIKKMDYPTKPDSKPLADKLMESKNPDRIEEEDNKSAVNQSFTSFRVFLDDATMQVFFRRMDWSPDGSLLLLPAAQYKKSPESPATAVVYAYRRGDLSTPCLLIPTNNKPALCVRFCPVIFKKDPEGPNTVQVFDLPYKMVYAIATTDSVLVYNTQCLIPIVIIANITGNIHYASITDMSWNSSKLLGISSSDGFCSFMIFEPSELGQELPKEEMDSELHETLYGTPEKESETKGKDEKQMISEVEADQMPKPLSPFDSKPQDGINNTIAPEFREQQVFITKTQTGEVKKRIQPKMINPL